MDARYFDEPLNDLPGVQPSPWDYGVHSFRTIDDEIGDTLRLRRAPD